MPFEDYMTTREVAEALKMKPSQVTRAVQRGKFTGAIKLGWFWVVPRDTVDKLKKKRRSRRSESVAQVA